MFSSYKNSALQHHLFFIKSGCRYLYTLWFNFRHFPRAIAKNLPIVFFKGAYAKISGKGKIVLTDSFIEGNKHVMVGSEVKDFDYQCEKTYLHVEGTLTFDGYVDIRRGAMIEVCGKMTIGDGNIVCSRARIRAYNSITIGRTVRISHETQIFDTNFHYSENPGNPQYNPCSAPIRIGSYCWIGNRTTINKGTILPDHTTVASNSLLSKDYSDLPPYSVIGGMPAKLLKSDFTSVWDVKREDEYISVNLNGIGEDTNDKYMSIDNKLKVQTLLENSERNVSLKYKTWIRRGGIAGMWIQPNSIEECCDVAVYLYDNKADFLTVGHTSNIYFKNSFSIDYILDTRNLKNFFDGGGLNCM